MNKITAILFFSAIIFASCAGSSRVTSTGGELVGEGSAGWAEPAPYGMVLIPRGSFNMGPSQIDSLWGIEVKSKPVSVDAFWMDDTEITNSEYRQFVNWVRDSIIRERLADPNYGNDETFKIIEDKAGNPITPRLNWSKPIPWKRPTEDQQRAIESVYVVNPFTGKTELDYRQMNFRYEWYDQAEAAKRRFRLNPDERVLNTDVEVDPNETVMISKDTAFVTEDGRIVNQTVTRPLSSMYDFINTRIINIYPDTTVWVNDFNNSYNETYMRIYFSHPGYNDYPVVGVTWEQAEAFCIWRTLFYRMGMGVNSRDIEPYRLPTEAEWEYAARNGKSEYIYPWSSEITMTDKGCFLANFKPGEGDYTKDGNLVTARVASFQPNLFGLYDMAGNVAEWTSTTYTEAGGENMNDLNSQYRYAAAKEDPYAIKKKVIKGGSWKDVSTFIRSDMRDSEYQNQPRSYIGFRCVRSQIGFAKAKK